MFGIGIGAGWQWLAMADGGRAAARAGWHIDTY